MALRALCLAAAAAAAAGSTVEARFEAWRREHGRSYATATEAATRLANFAAAEAEIDEHNSRSDSTYKLGLNALSDLSLAEVKARGRARPPTDALKPRVRRAPPPTGAAAAAVDWRAEGAVSPVRNQANCGGCWAFAAAGAVEGISAIRTGKLKTASVQEVIDCCGTVDKTKAPYCHGCSFGNSLYYYLWVMANGGLAVDSEYPFGGVTGACNRSEAAEKDFTIDAYAQVPSNDEAALTAALALQPVAVDIDVAGGFRSYKSGVFTDAACGTSTDHSVLLVGFNTTSTPPYYILKNSWSTGWGEAGYMRIGMGVNGPSGTCGLALYPSHPTKAGNTTA